MGTAEEEAYVTESGVGHHGKAFPAHLENLVSFELSGGDICLGSRDLVVFSLVFAKLKHWCVSEIHISV